ncbi:MAG: hypothetical protein SF339_24565 [Blastocatellia bacterium]|nr:hypothetical protein [Blastocatellia bacterium]
MESEIGPEKVRALERIDRIDGIFQDLQDVMQIPHLVNEDRPFFLTNTTTIMRGSMQQDLTTLKRLKYAAMAISGLMVAGIAILMFLARGTGEDITGIVAPALLITLLSSMVAIVAAILQRRVRQ